MLGFALLAGLFFCTSNILFNMALKHTIASNVMPFHYTMIVWGALYTYLIWGDVPSLNVVAGAALIIAAGAFVAARARKKAVADCGNSP